MRKPTKPYSSVKPRRLKYSDFAAIQKEERKAAAKKRKKRKPQQ